MKTKIFNILTVISAAYLIFSGGFNLYCTPFEQLKNIPIANFLAAISWKITLVIFGIFCLIKLFINQKITTNIFAILLSVVSCSHLILSVWMFSQIERYYLPLSIKYDWKLWLSEGIHFLFALIFLLVTINTLKPFISKNVAFVLSVAICVIGLIANIISTTYFANASLRYTINDFMVTKLQYICFLPTVYLALKPMTKEDVKNENQVE